MIRPTSLVMESLHAGLIIHVVGFVINGVSSQLSASPVVVSETQTASFRWQVPAVTGEFTVLYVISPSGTTVLLVSINNNRHQASPNYTARVNYTGALTASSKVMAFDLNSVVRSDAGNYTCGRNALNDIIPQCGQKLVVVGQPTKPTVGVAPAPVFGNQVILTCSSTSTTIPADHGLTLTYTWQRDDADIKVTSPGSPYTFTVSSRDSHRYRCRARESQGLESEWSQAYNLEPQYGPYAVTLQPSTPLSYTRREGQESVPSILCSATCKPACTYKWFKDGASHSDGATLTLPVANRSQTGSYKCQASNTHGTVDSSSVSVDVAYPPDQQSLEASCNCTIITAGATVGGILLTLLIGGIVLLVLYRKGYIVRNVRKGAARQSSSHLEPVEVDNRGDSPLDQITAAAQYSNVVEESEKQQYTQLKVYENTKAAAGTITYQGVTDAPPVTYESIRTSPYQNTEAPSQAAAGTITYQGVTDAPPVTYESIRTSPYQNTATHCQAGTITYQGVTDAPPVTYESIRTSPYQNTEAPSQGPDK